MAFDVVRSAITQKTSEGQQFEPLNRPSSMGGILGAIAAVIGLIAGGGRLLIPTPSIGPDAIHDVSYYLPATLFLGLLTLSLIVQLRGIRKLRTKLASSFPLISYILVLVGITATAYMFYGGTVYQLEGRIRPWATEMVMLGSVLIVFYQMLAVLYLDSSKNWIGLLAGLCNALLVPVAMIGHALNPALVYVAYVVFLVGQVFTALFWLAPESDIREFERSSDIAKFAFGIIGVLTFVVGAVATFVGPIAVEEGVAVWMPWSTMVSPSEYLTNPALVCAFCAMLMVWTTAIPRMGAKELRIDHVRKDIIKGGTRWFMMLLAGLGVFVAGIAGSGNPDVAASASFWMSSLPGSVIILAGALYVSRSDVITGMPLLVAGVLLTVHPSVLPFLVICTWAALLVAQILLLIETKVRGFASFSQGFLTMILLFGSSALFLMFLLGGFGEGPAALWPTNKWFNIGMFPDIPVAAQIGTVLALPTLVLLLRNMAVAGLAHLRHHSSDALLGMSFIFAFFVPLIAGSDVVSHQANIAAAVLIALYTISFVLVLSINLNLAGDVEDQGYAFEGTFIRMTTIVGMISGMIVVFVVLTTFAAVGTTPTDIARVITLLVVFVVGLEIICDIGWFLASVRLGIFRQGFKFMTVAEAQASVPVKEQALDLPVARRP